MTIFDALRRLFRFLFATPDSSGPDPDPNFPRYQDDPTPPTSPLTHGFEATDRTLSVAVYRTTGLDARHGRAPAAVIAEHVAQALRDAGYNYRVSFDHDPVSLPDDAAGSTLQAFSAQRRAGDHVNVLLGDRDGGGISYRGDGRNRGDDFWTGRYALVPAGNIDRYRAVREQAPAHPDDPRYWINVRAAIHEVGHTLGGTHSDRMVPKPHLVYQNLNDSWMNSPPP